MTTPNIGKNKMLAINLVSSIVAFAANLVINFFLTPYIVRKLGVEANGFVTLANNFISYASLATIALNSMAGRFISIKVHQNDWEGANEYYTAVTSGNMALALFMLIPATVLTVYLEHVINIPAALILDVKMLFGLMFINFLMSTAFSSWASATFITNRLYLQSIRAMQSQILRVAAIGALFVFLQPSVYYIAIAALASTLFVTAYNLHYKRKLLPGLHVNKRNFSLKALKELLSSGIWNTVLRTGQLLLDGLDLLISNLFIGAQEMGILALAKTLPSVITQLAGTVTSIFAPALTIDYAKGDLDSLRGELKKGMKLTGILITIPLSVLIVFGMDFYRLWVPAQDARVLQILSVLTCFGLIFTSGIQCLYNIFTVVNKLKLYSLMILLSGALNAIVVFLLLKTTNLGIYAVAGVSSFVNLARNMLFTVPFGAKYLNLKWNTFLPEVGTSVLSVVILVSVGFGIRYVIDINSWVSLFTSAALMAIAGLGVNLWIVLSSSERKYLANKVLKLIVR